MISTNTLVAALYAVRLLPDVLREMAPAAARGAAVLASLGPAHTTCLATQLAPGPSPWGDRHRLTVRHHLAHRSSENVGGAA